MWQMLVTFPYTLLCPESKTWVLSLKASLTPVLTQQFSKQTKYANQSEGNVHVPINYKSLETGRTTGIEVQANQQHLNSSALLARMRCHGRVPGEEGNRSLPGKWLQSAPGMTFLPGALQHFLTLPAMNPQQLQPLDQVLSIVFISKSKGIMFFTLSTPSSKVLINPLKQLALSYPPT